MNKSINFYIFFLCFLLVIVNIPNASAAFTPDHIVWSGEQFEAISSPITEQCSGKLQLIVDGNTAADIFVLHYTDKKKVSSYISTHTKGSGYEKCLEWAGTDTDLICFCYGIALHNVQDNFFHNKGGVVPKYIRNRMSSNLVGHMTIEDSFDVQFLEYKQSSAFVSGGKLDYYNSNVLNSLFEDPKYIDLLERMTGLSKSEIIRDANVFASQYKGTNFYDVVYNEKVQLPLSYQLPGIIISVFGFVLLFAFIYIPWLLKIKTTKWRFLVYLFFIVLIIFGIILLITLYTENTWILIRGIVRILPIQVSSNDISYYDKQITQATADFYKSGELPFVDASGLNHYDAFGNYVPGALQESEKAFLFVGLPLLILTLSILLSFLIFKMFNTKPIKSGFVKLFNTIGYVILSLVVVFIIYAIANLIIFK